VHQQPFVNQPPLNAYPANPGVRNSSTGFLFEEFSGEALQDAIARALRAYSNRSAWTERILRGMARDYSWTASAQEYRELYQAHHTVAEHE